MRAAVRQLLADGDVDRRVLSFSSRIGTAWFDDAEGSNDSPLSFVIFVTGYGGPNFHVGGRRSPSHRDQPLPSEAARNGPRRMAVAAGLPGVARCVGDSSVPFMGAVARHARGKVLVRGRSGNVGASRRVIRSKEPKRGLNVTCLKRPNRLLDPYCGHAAALTAGVRICTDGALRCAVDGRTLR